MPTPETIVRTLVWSSTTFPTGAFAYSQGLEWAIEAGDIRDWQQLVRWLTDLLQHGSLWADGILLRHAIRAQTFCVLQELAVFGLALASSRERRAETIGQGAAFARAVSVWGALPTQTREAAELGWPLPVVVGAAMRHVGIEEDPGSLAMLVSATSNLVSAATRLVPLGQTDALRAIQALEQTITAVWSKGRDALMEDIGGCCLRAEIATMRHEVQSTRLFRT